MVKLPEFPPDAERIRTYEEYGQFVDDFFTDSYHLLIVIGRPGLGKTESFSSRLNADLDTYLIKGNATPLASYKQLFWNRAKHRLILDDAEKLWSHKDGRRLVRSLTEIKPQKLITWETTNKDVIPHPTADQLKQGRVPTTFLTQNRTVLLCNKFCFGDQDEYEAIADRAHIIYFDPTPLAIHTEVGRWFYREAQEIYDWIGNHLHLMEKLSARTYLKAWERWRAGRDWIKFLEERCCYSSIMQVLQELESNESLTVNQRIEKFTAQTSYGRSSYFALKKDLEDELQLRPVAKAEAPKIDLTGLPPEEAPHTTDQWDQLMQEDDGEDDEEDGPFQMVG